MDSTTTWILDPAHSNVLFSVRHLGISTVRGKFDSISGKAEFDRDDASSFHLHVDIDANSFDTGNDQRDAHVKGADFLDVVNYPVITYEAHQIAKVRDDEYMITGELTIKGMTHEAQLKVEGPSPEMKDPGGNTKIGLSATAAINRKDYGITFNHVMDAGVLLIGEELKIMIDVQFTKSEAKAADVRATGA